MDTSPDTTWIGDCLARLRNGEPAARDELLAFAAGRLERLARKMLHDQFGRLGRWVDTNDVFQSAAVRLWRALACVVPESPLHFHRLAARQVRLELLDLARQYYGPQGIGANYSSWCPPGGESSAPLAPDRPAPDGHAPPASDWAELHALVQTLPEDEAEVTDLMFYQGLTQEAVAELIGSDVRTVQRRWQRARRKLGERLGNLK